MNAPDYEAIARRLAHEGRSTGEGRRYSSWDDAETGHRTFVRKCREAIGQKVTEQR